MDILLNKKMKYDPETGVLNWVKTDGSLGRTIATKNIEGYLRFQFQGKCVLAHRAAWFLHYGVMPSRGIDHINGIRTDNRIVNLRCVHQSVNARNQKVHREGKLWGAHKWKKWWQSEFTFNKKRYFLGLFRTEIEAHLNTKKHLSRLITDAPAGYSFTGEP